MLSDRCWRTAKQAANYLGISTSCLKQWRRVGKIKPEAVIKTSTGRFMYSVEMITTGSDGRLGYFVWEESTDWGKVAAEVAELSKDQLVNVVIKWPEKPSMPKRLFIKLLRAAGACSIEDTEKKVWL